LVWALWSLTLVVVIAFPALLSDPAMWFYLLDPELLALMIIVGTQMAWPYFGAWLRAVLTRRDAVRESADA
jgi:hypothetical protein